MIEPQNTMMPLPAAPAPTDASQGEGVGFGEMLAQSLGVAAAIDPNAVQQIASDNGQNPQFGDEAAEAFVADTGPVPVVDEQTNPASANRPVTLAVAVPIVRAGVANPVPGGGERVVVDTQPTLPVAGEAGPGRTLPRPAVPVEGTGPIDGIWKPVLTSEPDLAVAPGLAASSRAQAQPTAEVVTPIETIGLPIRADDPASPTPGAGSADARTAVPVAAEARPSAPIGHQPVRPDVPGLPPQPDPTVEMPAGRVPTTHHATAAAARKVDPGLLRPEPTRPDPLRPTEERTIPVSPVATAAVQSTDAAPARVAWPAVTAQPRINLNPETQVHFEDAKVAVAKTSAPTGGAVVETPVPATSTPVILSPVDVAPVPATATDVASPVAPTQYSGLAERVLRAVAMQANQPPPRTMIVDIPEMEGLRLVVSVRGGAQVHVVPTTGSSTPEAFRPFMDELSGVLADRGFEMTGDGRRRGNNPYQQEQQQVPFRLHRPTLRRPAPADNDLRI